MEIVRLAGAPFSDQELETINSYLVWGSMVLALADKVDIYRSLNIPFVLVPGLPNQ